MGHLLSLPHGLMISSFSGGCSDWALALSTPRILYFFLLGGLSRPCTYSHCPPVLRFLPFRGAVSAGTCFFCPPVLKFLSFRGAVLTERQCTCLFSSFCTDFLTNSVSALDHFPASALTSHAITLQLPCSSLLPQLFDKLVQLRTGLPGLIRPEGSQLPLRHSLEGFLARGFLA